MAAGRKDSEGRGQPAHLLLLGPSEEQSSAFS